MSKDSGRRLTEEEKRILSGYGIPQIDLDNAVIHEGLPWYEILPRIFPEIFAVSAETVGNDVHLNPDRLPPENRAALWRYYRTLLHESVHVGRFRTGETTSAKYTMEMLNDFGRDSFLGRGRANSHEKPAYAAQEAADFIYGARQHDDVAWRNGQVGQTTHRQLSSLALKWLVDKGLVVKIDNNNRYVIPGVGIWGNGLGNTLPSVTGRQGINSCVLTDENGVGIELINESEHKWTPQYVGQHIMHSDAIITHYGNTTPAKDYKPAAEESNAYKALLEYMALKAKNHGITAPKIIINRNAHPDIIFSEQSAEGNEYTYIPQAQLEGALSSPIQMEKLKKWLGNEMEWIKAGNNSPETMAKYHNDEATKHFAAHDGKNGTQVVFAQQAAAHAAKPASRVIGKQQCVEVPSSSLQAPGALASSHMSGHSASGVKK